METINNNKIESFTFLVSGRNFSLKEMETNLHHSSDINQFHTVRKELLSERDGNSLRYSTNSL